MPLTPGNLLVLFVLLFVVFRGLEWLRPRHKRTPLFRRGLTTDLSYWALGPTIIDAVIGILALVVMGLCALVLYGQVERSEILRGFGPLSVLPVLVQAAMMLVIADFIGYWTHRGLHGRRLWRFHAIHHSATTLDWLSAVRNHPVAELIGRIAIMVPLLALGFQPEAVIGLAPFLGLYALLLHANLDWDYGPMRTVIVSPRYHRWHHAIDFGGDGEAGAAARARTHGCNFAPLFPVWDIAFGTYFMPHARVPEAFGTTTPVPDGLFAQLAFPFRRSAEQHGPAANSGPVREPSLKATSGGQSAPQAS